MKIGRFILIQLRDIAIILIIGLVLSTILGGAGIWRSYDALKISVIYTLAIGFSLWKGNILLGSILTKIYGYFGPKPSTVLVLDLLSTFVITVLIIFGVNYFLFPFTFGITIFENFQFFLLLGVVLLFISLFISSVFIIKDYFNYWLTASLSEEKFKREALSQQYETLKSYVNPHFLFNSLSVLSSLVEEDTGKSQEFIKQLSANYRYVMEQKDKEVIPLEEELEFIRSFIRLYQIRYGDNLSVEIDIKNTAGYIIPMSLQILLENCFKHNIISEEKPLQVRIWREENHLFVNNNLQIRKTMIESGGVGLDTIQKRYELLTNTPMEIKQTEAFFTVKIPVLNKVKN